MMVRTDPAGTLLDAAPVRLTSRVDQEPDIAASPGGFLVVWERYTGGKSIMAARVTWTGAGAVEVGPEFIVGPFVDEEAEPEVIWTGSNFLVTWAYRGADNLPATIVGRRVNADGTSPDAVAITLVTGVRAKDRAMFSRAGCVQMVTMPEPGEKILQTQQVCYGAVIDVGSPVPLTVLGVDRPEDPSASVEPVSGTVWVAWEDSRHIFTPADEDIYLRRFGAPATELSALCSRASETPAMDGSPMLAGDWMAWLHKGGDTAAGLVVNKLGGSGGLWFPAYSPWKTLPQGGNRPGIFTIMQGHDGSEIVLRLNHNRGLSADQITHVTYCPTGIGCGTFQNSMSLFSSVYSVESVAGVSAEMGVPPFVMRTAMAAAVGYSGAVQECVVLAQQIILPYSMIVTRLGFPPSSGLPAATIYLPRNQDCCRRGLCCCRGLGL